MCRRVRLVCKGIVDSAFAWGVLYTHVFVFGYGFIQPVGGGAHCIPTAFGCRFGHLIA